jgi:drug/metabolite transporter (DMT)-like permease
VVRNGFGFVLGFLGVVMLFLTDLRSIGPEAVVAGAIFLISPLSAVLGNTAAKRWGAQVSSLKLNRDGMIIGTVLLWAVALPVERGAELHWTPRAIFSVTYLTLIGTVVTFGLYYWLLRYATARKMSLIAYVIPVVALALGVVVGQEPVGLETLIGTAMILGGVTLAARK